MRETRWHFIRHAPVDNPDGRVYGASDQPANTSDTATFEILANHLPNNAIAVVSHLKRTLQTMEALQNAGLDVKGPIIDRRLSEQDFGDWVGLTYEEINVQYRETYRRFWLSPVTERAPGGESFLDVVLRVQKSLEELSKRFMDRDIICIAHGGSIRAALSLALDVDPSKVFPFSTCNLSTTLIDRLHPEPNFSGGWRIRGTNIPPI